jgi:hypothetical protein
MLDDFDSPCVAVAGPAAPQQARRSLSSIRPVSISSIGDEDEAEDDIRAQILANMQRSGVKPERLQMNQSF